MARKEKYRIKNIERKLQCKIFNSKPSKNDINEICENNTIIRIVKVEELETVVQSTLYYVCYVEGNIKGSYLDGFIQRGNDLYITFNKKEIVKR